MPPNGLAAGIGAVLHAGLAPVVTTVLAEGVAAGVAGSCRGKYRGLTRISAGLTTAGCCDFDTVLYMTYRENETKLLTSKPGPTWRPQARSSTD